MSSSIFVTTNTNTDKRNKYRDELGNTGVATVEGKLSKGSYNQSVWFVARAIFVLTGFPTYLTFDKRNLANAQSLSD